MSLILFIFFAKGTNRKRLVKYNLGILLAFTAIIFIKNYTPHSQPAQLVDATIERIKTLITSKTLYNKESTLKWRNFEYPYAIRKCNTWHCLWSAKWQRSYVIHRCSKRTL